MGPERILAGTKAVADQVFPAIARFAQDSSQQTRYYSRKMLFSMMSHPDFDKMLEKYVPTKDVPYIKESVSSLREKGLGEMPVETTSAGGGCSHAGSVGGSRSSSSRRALSVTDRETAQAREVTRKRAPRGLLGSDQAEQTVSFQGPKTSRGTFIPPPLSSPRNSPNHLSPPAVSPKKSEENAVNFSNSLPFEGQPEPRSQKQLLSQKPGDKTGEDLQEKLSPLQLKSTLVPHQAPRRSLNGSRPLPCMPHLPSLLPNKFKLNVTEVRKEECEELGLAEVGRKPAADVSQLNVDGEEVDREEMQNSLRYLRIAVARKRAELMRNLPSLENPGPALNRDRSGESPSHASCPSLGSCSRSGIYSQGSLTSPAPAAPRRRRRTSDTFPLLGSKPQPARVSSGRSRDSKGAEDNFSPDGVSLETQGFYKGQAPSVTPRPEVMDPSELQPFSKPEEALTEALALLAEENWEKKIEGLNFVRRLSAYHATVLTAELHEISLAVAQEVKNLRSGVSRAAVVCLGDLFTCLKKSMDPELDNAVKVLLHKAGEPNTFIREEVDKALKAMVNNVTPARALCSLINGGQSHLHAAVRRCTAQHLSDTVDRMGPERILAGTKAVADQVFPAIASFAQDSSQQTRYYSRKMLFSMMSHPDFDKMLEKYVPTKDVPYIKESVSSLREKGLGEMPVETTSAGGGRSRASSVGRSRSSTSGHALSVTDRETAQAREVTRKRAPRGLLGREQYVRDITALLNAKDFRDRIKGIKQLLSDTENNPDMVVVNIVKIFDAFVSCLRDLNSKVSRFALETLHKMIPLLKDDLSPVISLLIPAVVDNNLNSKNPGVYAAATNVIQALYQHVDNSLLLLPFCTKCQFLKGKAQRDMTEKLADLVTVLYARKPGTVEQKVLGVLWQLLENTRRSGSLQGADGDIQAATAKLARALYTEMGQRLITRAASQPPHIQRTLERFLAP
ncbi:TOG array regulator of axonemal microtubules protein 1 [Podargus strigoides]